MVALIDMLHSECDKQTTRALTFFKEEMNLEAKRKTISADMAAVVSSKAGNVEFVLSFLQCD